MTTTNEWRDLPTFEDVADAKRAGDEIEILVLERWEAWLGESWDRGMNFRARPAQPKMKKIKMLCYLTTSSKSLMWYEETESVPDFWRRVPSEDKEIEVPE